MNSSLLWYVGRGSGVVSLMLLTVVVVLGISQRGGRSFAGMSRLVVASVHRSAALLSVVFLGIHVGTLLLDPYAGVKLISLILPFTAGYRPFSVGLGAIALDLIAALVVTSLLREWISARFWRAIHWFAYAMWPVALLHGFGSGTDRSRTWMLGIDGVCILAVLTVFFIAHPALREPADTTGRPRTPNPPPVLSDSRRRDS